LVPWEWFNGELVKWLNYITAAEKDSPYNPGGPNKQIYQSVFIFSLSQERAQSL